MLRPSRRLTNVRTAVKIETPAIYYTVMSGVVFTALIVVFALFWALDLELLRDPGPYLRTPSILAAALGIGLLVGDALLPVPSALVMVANGALFGFWSGSGLSLAGSLGGAFLSYALGRLCLTRLGRHLGSPAERTRAEQLLDKWGLLAVLVTRPLPLVADTVAVVAGATRMPPRRFGLAALAGILPAATVYAATGAYVRDFGHSVFVFAGVLAIAALHWLAGRHLARGRRGTERGR